MKKLFPFLLVLTVFFKGSIFAQSWVHFNSLNSQLPDDHIQKIASDTNGNTWIASYGGLTKFDGNTWITYNTSNSSLPSNICYSLAIQNNIVWIGTTNGLAKFDLGIWTIYNTTNSGIPGNYITEIEIQDSSTLWIGTWQHGCAKFDGIAFTNFDSSNSGLPSDNIISIEFQTDSNFVWIASYPFGGISKYDFSNWTNYSPLNSNIPSFDVNGIRVDDSNYVWITSSGGVAKFDGSDWIVFDSSNTAMYDNRTLEKPCIDVAQNIWIASNYMGLVFFDHSSWQFFDTINSPLTSNSIQTLFIDQENNKWIGTYDGIFIFNDSGVTLSNHSYLVNPAHISVYPNPTIDFVRIEGIQSCIGYIISASDGKTVRSCFYDNALPWSGQTISLQNLSSGLYYINVQTSNKMSFKIKIIKL